MENVAILIPVFNKLEYTKKCLSNLTGIFGSIKDSDVTYEIIVIDDNSKDGTYQWISENYQDVNILKGDGNLWWSGGINMGAQYAVETLHSTYVLLWNNDIEVDVSYFKVLEKLIKKYPKGVILGSKIFGNLEKKLVWSMGGVFNPVTGRSEMIGYLTPDNDKLNIPIEADWLTGMGTLVPSEIIRKIGYWDKENFPQYIGDMEFTYRAKLNGYKNIVHPDLQIWNDTSNTGLLHQGSFINLFRMLTDKRSLYNLKVNFCFYRRYVKSPRAYIFLFISYFKLFGGFIKWKFLYMIGVKRKLTFE
jgi:GT2 family glycosyltransferase